MKKIIFVILDGLGGRPVEKFDGKTSLEAAETPNLDRMAREGITGMIDVLGKGVRPDSDTAHLTLFGYNLDRYYPGRGPIEALGIKMELEEGDVALRANLGTVDENLIVVDRRAGRIESTKPFVEKVDGTEIEGIKFIIRPGTGHRAALVLRGKGLSDEITNGDPHKVEEGVLRIKPKNSSEEAKFTAEVLNRFLDKAHHILRDCELNKERLKKGKYPGNYLLVRGAGEYKKIPTFEEKWGTKACCVAGAGLYKGLGYLTGMEVLEVEGATGLPNTDVQAKFTAARDSLEKKGFDLAFVHVKPPDNLAEDGNCQGKKEFIEKIDRAAEVLLNSNALVAVTGDHSTPCVLKDHSGDPVPILIWGEGKDQVMEFGETACKKGGLGRFEGKEEMEKVMELAGRTQ